MEAIAKGPSCNTFQLPLQASIASSFGIALGNVQSKGTSNRSAAVPCFGELGHQCPIDLKSCNNIQKSVAMRDNPCPCLTSSFASGKNVYQQNAADQLRPNLDHKSIYALLQLFLPIVLVHKLNL